jgi:PAS domain S-box-containing protein
MPLRYDPLLAKLEPLRTIRQNKPLGCAVALAGVTLSVVVRSWAGEVAAIGTFITFYPAVILAAATGGLRPGLLAAGLSVLAADYLFIPPVLSLSLTAGQAVMLGLFGLNLTLIVAVIGLLHATLDRLWQQEGNLRFILDSEPVGIIAVDSAGVITLVNEAIVKQLGYRRDELLGRSVDLLLPERFRASHDGHIAAYMGHPESRSMGAGRDLFAVSREGNEIPVEIGLNPITREGKAGALATVVDISERKQAERQQAILTHEIQHRAGNLLAIVQAVAMRILTPERPIAEARRLLMGNLAALARTQQIFSASGAAALGEILKRETSLFEQQVETSGVEVWLNNSAAQNMSLIVHELCTNAVKYGALSRPEGRLAITWSIEEGYLLFHWRELGGPSVVKPSRRGFGQSVLHNLASLLGARVESQYAAEGFQYRLAFARQRLGSRLTGRNQRGLSRRFGRN